MKEIVEMFNANEEARKKLLRGNIQMNMPILKDWTLEYRSTTVAWSRFMSNLTSNQSLASASLHPTTQYKFWNN